MSVYRKYLIVSISLLFCSLAWSQGTQIAGSPVYYSGINVNIGGNGNGTLHVRAIEGKKANSSDADDLFLNYYSMKNVHVGGLNRPANLVVHGKVGMGTTTPLSKLHISTNSSQPLSSAIMDYSGTVISGTDANLDLLSTDDNSTVSNNISFGRYNQSTGALIHKFGITSWAETGNQGSNSGDRISFNYGTQSNIWTNSELMVIKANGNIGVGTTSPAYKLHVNGSTYTQGLHSSTAINIYSPQAGNTSKRVTINTLTGNSAYMYNYDEVAQTFHTMNFGGSHNLNSGITVLGDGHVGIGTNDPNHKLEVNGTIRSKKVKVEAVNWPDYVFISSYKLRPLSEVETFIKTNEHLPEVPSAKELEEKGLDLGAMDATLLKKVEELTLYMIEMKKEIEQLKKKNRELEQQVNK